MKKVKIDLLRPTQVTHGLREILDKTKTYESLTGHDLDMAIAEKPVPVVLGPDGAPFAIDHHHVASALWRAGIKSVPFVLVCDLSSLTRADFWLTMENNRWAYPYDAQGRRVAFADLRDHVWELIDDDFRSLSAAVRDAGGYEKTSVPLEEFRWSDFLRRHLPPPESDADYDALVKKGVKLAKTKVALGLPGYLGPAD
jgi:YD repeat-containing protein